MESIYLIKIGEISLKGGNRGFFEAKLKRNIKLSLKGYQTTITNQAGRFYLQCLEADDETIKKALSRVFGIVGFTKALCPDKSLDEIRKAALILAEDFVNDNPNSTFKAESRRSDKSFEKTSYELSADIGALLLDKYKSLKVDVKKPDWTIKIEVREKAFVYGKEYPGPGGLPVGCAGRGTLLLSGGIDSPVAAYMMAKRGLKLNAVYFHAYPYTSDDAKDKVIKLAEIISPYTGGINLYIVPFTDAQLVIKQKARTEETTLLMRACMMKIAGEIGKSYDSLCLVTGEALSQVASQTVQSLNFTGHFSSGPVFRPLVGLDKEEIIKIAQKINTFETSILPFEDCCTIFSPKHPVVKPDFDTLLESFNKLEIEDELKKAVENTERIYMYKQ